MTPRKKPKRKTRAGKPIEDEIVEALFGDIRDRSLLKWLFSNHEMRVCTHFESIDLEVQDEIKEAWRKIVRTKASAYLKEKGKR